MPDPTFAVADIFFSIQGEGMNTGRAALFLRLAGCNLACPWCDTDYLIRERLSIQEIRNRLAELIPDSYPKGLRRRPFLVLTGGEPTIQDIPELVDGLADYELALETNGLNSVPPGFSWVAVSPKRLGLSPSAMEMATEFKVVVDEKTDPMPLIAECLRSSADRKVPIWLQPEGNKGICVDACEKLLCVAPERLRIGHQMHKIRNWK